MPRNPHTDDNEATAISSTLVEVRSWSDPPERGRTADDWPYPTSYVESAPPESLRQAIYDRTGEQGGEVYLREIEVSSGYSDYTQENEFYVEVLVNDEVAYKTPGAWSGGGAILHLLDWLDDKDEVTP